MTKPDQLFRELRKRVMFLKLTASRKRKKQTDSSTCQLELIESSMHEKLFCYQLPYTI